MYFNLRDLTTSRRPNANQNAVKIIQYSSDSQSDADSFLGAAGTPHPDPSPLGNISAGNCKVTVPSGEGDT